MAAHSSIAPARRREPVYLVQGNDVILIDLRHPGRQPMGREIERKFLVLNDSWRPHAAEGVRYLQGYLANNERCSVRVRIAGAQAWLNIKSAVLDISRLEYDFPFPVAQAKEILTHLCERPLIEKTRYHVPHADREWEIDVFEGENQGLIIAEIELHAADETFAKPDWVGADVSHDPRYYNVNLVTHPYRAWSCKGTNRSATAV